MVKTTKNLNKWWFAPQFRVNVGEHNIKQSSLPKDSEVTVRLSHNEKMVLDSLALMISGTTSEALRVALYEGSRYETMESQSSREKRDRRVKVKMTSIEYLMLTDLAEKWDLKVSEALRSLVLTLVPAIRNYKVRSLGGCKFDTQKERMKAHDEKRAQPGYKKNEAVIKGRATAYVQKKENAEAWQEHLDYWRPIIDEFIRTNRAPKFCWVGEGAASQFDPPTFIFWYNNVYDRDNNGEQAYEDAISNPDRERAIPALAAVILSWCRASKDDKITEDEALAEATEIWESHNDTISEEDMEEVEDFLSDLRTELGWDTTAGPEDYTPTPEDYTSDGSEDSLDSWFG